MRNHTIRIALFIIACSVMIPLCAQDFRVVKGAEVRVFLPKGLDDVARTALAMMSADAESVLDAKVVESKSSKADIVCGINKNLRREGFEIVSKQGRLLIYGADSHGIAYGLLEVSRLMGVSPWEWWADCTPRMKDVLTIPSGYVDSQYPRVSYRGIFINDEDWGILPWATKREDISITNNSSTRIKGGIGPETNEKIFQLLLRLRANYYWPAMHECSQPFFLIPGNREVAAKYGIYIGGSHCEPMASSTATEWALRGEGEYNYVTNREKVLDFWSSRLDEVAGQDIVYTIGMRGVHDGSMQGVKTREDKVKYLQMVIDDQRAMLDVAAKKHRQETFPQVFVPYKEVLDIYKSGLKVADDVTLMWTDDNYGYIRHFPDSIEARRQGGNGIYYHVSYWGRPHDYLWLSTLSPYLMRQQMTEAYQRGIREMWILNVGDIKPAEYHIEDFINMAWHGLDDARGLDAEYDALKAFYQREFGDEALSIRLADIMTEHYRLSYECKPEHIAGTRTEEADKTYWNTIRPIHWWNARHAADRVSRYTALSDEVERIWQSISTDRKDAYMQLVKYPVQASAQMNIKYLCPMKSEEAHDSIVVLTRLYNEGIENEGKFRGIMDMSPRNLVVFNKINNGTLPLYPNDSTSMITLPVPDDVRLLTNLGYDGNAYILSKGQRVEYSLDNIISASDAHVESATDSIDIELRLLPNHPVDTDGRLAISVCVDGHNTVVAEYQTYDRSEEWKQNVLRNQAIRRLRLPFDKTQSTHILTIQALTEGVVIDQVLLVK